MWKFYLSKNKTKLFNGSFENEKEPLLRNDCSLDLISHHFSNSPYSSLKWTKRLTLSRWGQTASVPRVPVLYTCPFLRQKHPSFLSRALKLLFCLPFGVATPLSSLILPKVTLCSQRVLNSLQPLAFSCGFVNLCSRVCDLLRTGAPRLPTVETSLPGPPLALAAVCREDTSLK